MAIQLAKHTGHVAGHGDTASHSGGGRGRVIGLVGNIPERQPRFVPQGVDKEFGPFFSAGVIFREHLRGITDDRHDADSALVGRAY